MGNLFQWLFTDPQTACSSASAASSICASIKTANGTQYIEVFHYWIPWIVFVALGLLIPAYYAVEGRRRLVKGRSLPLHKILLDKFMNQLALWAVVAPFIMFGRYALDSSFFAWRLWRYGWLAWGAGIGIYWLVYFARRYHRERDQYLTRQMLGQYVPAPRARRKAVTRAG
jgi:hypothetical protein